MTYKIIKLQTNKKRNYILLSDIFDWFEPEIIGGTKKSESSSRKAYVIYGNIETVEDFIVSDKKIFRQRKRRFVTAFLDQHGLHKGDLVRVERLAPFTYRFLPG
ncbi:hypothetical protein V476_25305 [Pseudomonas syringae KCTC 12500]|uniref:hypothetical protein n=1 Tax=Pseudomonas syringae TaxID=317 RepID=UPI00046A8532|nr:hypothetical protein [Pseudomonas syringae]KMY04256.1 hypothetical protein V476_25305 [Pseudomonas syringae KCTC 12500]KPY67268.1 hypothetical protein ALO45_02400 [Pseudomonas syringae pv. syringae]POR87567.1 hypothetical protein BKM21_02740 [Pseudomonas syringae pv. syringae]